MKAVRLFTVLSVHYEYILSFFVLAFFSNFEDVDLRGLCDWRNQTEWIEWYWPSSSTSFVWRLDLGVLIIDCIDLICVSQVGERAMLQRVLGTYDADTVINGQTARCSLSIRRINPPIKLASITFHRFCKYRTTCHSSTPLMGSSVKPIGFLFKIPRRKNRAKDKNWVTCRNVFNTLQEGSP